MSTTELAGDELKKRRERLLELKEKAGSMGAAGAGATPQPSSPGPNAGAGAQAGMSFGGGAQGAPSMGAGATGAAGPAGEAFGGDRSKYFASFLLNTLRARPEDEEGEPTMVPGTAFTEYGLGRLMDGLKERNEQIGAAAKQISKRFYDFLTSPAQEGQKMDSGVNLEHLERFVNLLQKMQQVGWEGVRQDLMSPEGRDDLAAFSKPQLDRLDEEVATLKERVAALEAKLAAQ